jgi:hypothetical protein
MFPDSIRFRKSGAEVSLFGMLRDSLGDRWMALHHVRWLQKELGKNARSLGRLPHRSSGKRSRRPQGEGTAGSARSWCSVWVRFWSTLTTSAAPNAARRDWSRDFQPSWGLRQTESALVCIVCEPVDTDGACALNDHCPVMGEFVFE